MTFESSTRALERRLRTAFEEGLRQSMQEMREEAQDNAPVQTGALRDSADDDVIVGRRFLTGEVTFNVPYAAIVHEDPERSSRPNFLRDAADRIARDKTIQREIQRATRRIP